MKQIVTIFRAEAVEADRLLRLCRTARKHDLLGLRDSLREPARSTALLVAYIEFLDVWSMGDDFARVMGDTARRRQGIACELYSHIVSPSLAADVQQQAIRKHQFSEQAMLARMVASLSCGQMLPGNSASLALFRDVVGDSATDEEIKYGSTKHSR